MTNDEVASRASVIIIVYSGHNRNTSLTLSGCALAGNDDYLFDLRLVR